ncbi:MAG: hypothetical protein Q9162_000195 [Coniocarpon cinnabarinum]
MAEQEEDFSSLPLQDRFAHKNWKARKDGYEAAAKEFDSAQTENDPVVRQFIADSSLWKGAVTDSNAAAHQEALNALQSFLQIARTQGCIRTRNSTVASLAEKGLISSKPVAKQKALECILLYVELDKPDPVLEELLPLLSHKLPKIIAATLNTFSAIYHNFGCKTVDPKPVLKSLPKVFGHADKNVRAEAQNLTVELYRWLREGMKPIFWNELKPVQQADLEKLFQKVKDEPAPKAERLLRSQQAAQAPDRPASNEEEAGADGESADEEVHFEPEIMAVDVFPKIPKDFSERLASSKWKDRKEALDDLHTAINFPAIEDGPFDDIVRGLVKCMKDANIAVVTEAGNCVELLARGLRRSFTKYRSTIITPMMERLKERKQSVTDALAGGLDAVCSSTSLSDCLEEALGFLANKNPQIKLGATHFLIRNLKNTREAPTVPEVKQIADATNKLLTDSQETQRNAACEVLGVLLKIMGERIMNVHMNDLDDIRKAKVKESADVAEVKAKYKPAPAASAPKAAPVVSQKKAAPKKSAPSASAAAKKAPPAQPAASPEESSPALQPKPTARSGIARPGAPASAPRGLKPPGGRKLGTTGSAGPAPTSPRRTVASPPPPSEEQTPAPKVSRGLAGRTLTKPTSSDSSQQPQNPSSTTQPLPSLERIELDELRAEVGRLRHSNEGLRAEHLKFISRVQELENQNAQLIEDHTRDTLSIKAKETQLVRARSDAESAEQQSSSLGREVERLKRELGRMGRAVSPRTSDFPSGRGAFAEEETVDVNGVQGFSGLSNRHTVTSPTYSAGKENAAPNASVHGKPLNRAGSNASGDRNSSTSPRRSGNAARPLSSGRTAPGSTKGTTNGYAASRGSSQGAAAGRPSATDARNLGLTYPGPRSTDANPGVEGGVESWKRAAEVTQNLKARIELMKARQQQQGR